MTTTKKIFDESRFYFKVQLTTFESEKIMLLIKKVNCDKLSQLEIFDEINDEYFNFVRFANNVIDNFKC